MSATTHAMLDGDGPPDDRSVPEDVRGLTCDEFSVKGVLES